MNTCELIAAYPLLKFILFYALGCGLGDVLYRTLARCVRAWRSKE